MFMKIIPTGLLESNCIVLGDAGEGAVIDPGVEVPVILRELHSQQLALKYIILTHAHFDHIIHVEELKKSAGGEVVIHEADAPLLVNPILNGSMLFGLNRMFNAADRTVRDGDSLVLGGLKLEIIHTPGHTPGSMCIRMSQAAAGKTMPVECIFTGDTLFRLGVGRTDLGAGDDSQLLRSLQRLMELEDHVKVWPGHGPSSEIGYERRHNPAID